MRWLTAIRETTH